MDSVSLAGVLKRVYSSFDMLSFDNRLKLQKVIYLLKERGIDLGYSFRFYVFGPYSTDLARNGFQMKPFSESQELRFETEAKEKIFETFKSKIMQHKDDKKWLEAAASIVFLFKMRNDKTSVFEQIKQKNTPFEESYLDGVFKELIDYGWLNGN